MGNYNVKGVYRNSVNEAWIGASDADRKANGSEEWFKNAAIYEMVNGKKTVTGIKADYSY